VRSALQLFAWSSGSFFVTRRHIPLESFVFFVKFLQVLGCQNGFDLLVECSFQIEHVSFQLELLVEQIGDLFVGELVAGFVVVAVRTIGTIGSDAFFLDIGAICFVQLDFAAEELLVCGPESFAFGGGEFQVILHEGNPGLNHLVNIGLFLGNGCKDSKGEDSSDDK